MNTTFTVGQIFRLGLLKNSSGQPYTSKASVLNVIRLMPGIERKKGIYGMQYVVHKNLIDKHNRKWDN